MLVEGSPPSHALCRPGIAVTVVETTSGIALAEFHRTLLVTDWLSHRVLVLVPPGLPREFRSSHLGRVSHEFVRSVDRGETQHGEFGDDLASRRTSPPETGGGGMLPSPPCTIRVLTMNIFHTTSSSIVSRPCKSCLHPMSVIS